MPYDLFLALLLFSVAISFTPGPNNILLAVSAVNFGFARSMPQALGVTAGFTALLAACGAGLGFVFTAAPALQWVLKAAGALYMLWFAWKVATAHRAEGDVGTLAQPITFWQAAVFQWVNPKALVAALSAIAVYVRPGHALADFSIMLAVLLVCTVASTPAWAGFGVGLRRLLREPRHARIFNLAMALLLVASIVPMVA